MLQWIEKEEFIVLKPIPHLRVKAQFMHSYSATCNETHKMLAYMLEKPMTHMW